MVATERGADGDAAGGSLEGSALAASEEGEDAASPAVQAGCSGMGAPALACARAIRASVSRIPQVTSRGPRTDRKRCLTTPCRRDV